MLIIVPRDVCCTLGLHLESASPPTDCTKPAAIQSGAPTSHAWDKLQAPEGHNTPVLDAQHGQIGPSLLIIVPGDVCSTLGTRTCSFWRRKSLSSRAPGQHPRFSVKLKQAPPPGRIVAGPSALQVHQYHNKATGMHERMSPIV